jgi:alpha-mannosidase
MPDGRGSDQQSEYAMALTAVATPLPFLQSDGTSLLQAIRISISTEEVEPGRRCAAIFSGDGKRDEHDLGELMSTENVRTVLLPESGKVAETTVELIYGDRRWIGTILRQPVRRWTVHLVLHSHTDLGFTAPVSDVAQLHNQNTDQAIEFCRETTDWPAGSRFKWTCEVSWQVRNYIRDRSPDLVNALMHLVSEDSIAIGALYSGEHTDLLGHEEAVRSLSFAGTLRRNYQVPCDTALLCDVPGCTAGLVQMMAKSGVSNFILADNNFVAPFLARTDLPRPFLWQGADGTEVLCWYTDHPYYAYAEGEYYGFLESKEKVETMLGDKLLALELDGYTFDRFQIQYAFDNAKISFRPAEIVREWNATWAFPKIVLSTAREFLNVMRAEHALVLPRRKGDWTNWWGNIVSGFPAEETLTRKCHDRLPAVETLMTHLTLLSDIHAYPGTTIDDAYHGLLAFDEHSGSGIVWKPKSREDQERALREGYGFLYDAEQLLSDLERNACSRLSDLISHGGEKEALAVYNPSGLASNGVAEYVLGNRAGDVAIQDEVTGTTVSTTMGTGGEVRFRVSNVPAYGYRTYRVIPTRGSQREPSLQARVFVRGGVVVLENASCRVIVDRASGACTSVFDVAIGRNYCRDDASMNEPLVYVSHPIRKVELGKYIPEIYSGVHNPGEFLPWPSISHVKVSWDHDPVFGARCIVSHVIAGKRWLIQEYLLDAVSNHVTITNTLPRTVCSDEELRNALNGFLREDGLLYFAFPFDVPGGRFEYESPGMILTPPEDQFKGVCHDFFAVQRWCSVVGEDISVAMTVSDTPLVDVGSVGHLCFKDRVDSDQSRLFTRAVTLRDWGGEDESPYSRTQDLVFRFRFKAFSTFGRDEDQKKMSGRFEAYRFALAENRPFRAFPLKRENAAALPAGQHTFLKVSPENVEIMTSKRAEKGKGLVLRVREVCGTPVRARVVLPGMRINMAHRAMATEEPLDQLTTDGRGIDLSLEPFAIETIVLEVEPEGK